MNGDEDHQDHQDPNTELTSVADAVGGSDPTADTRSQLFPMAQTIEAIGELDPMVADDDLLEQLVQASGRVRRLVPDCIGISMTLRNESVTFTLVASDAQVALLDAVQYVAGGPCIDAVTTGAVIDLHTRDRLDWPIFTHASRQLGVATTLSLPLRDDGRGAAGVNLYGASVGCFDGHHDALARVFGTLANDAVVDADLAFATRTAALSAPRILRERVIIDVATALLGSALHLDEKQAGARVTDAAARAGLAEVDVARLLTTVLESDPSSTG